MKPAHNNPWCNMTTRTLNLTRPIVCFDLETTGLETKTDRVVEISCVKIHTDMSRETLTLRINPQMPIPQAAAAVHGITNEDIANEPTFDMVAGRLADFLSGCDLTGFNLERFDLPLLRNEFVRARITFPDGPVNIIDAHKIFIKKEPRDLSAAYRFYCDKTLDNAHSAEADAVATADILLAQIARYEDLPMDTEGLQNFCKSKPKNALDPDGKIVWNTSGMAVLSFGKHRNRTLQQLASQEPDYLRWISDANFSDEVRGLCKGALDGTFPVQN